MIFTCPMIVAAFTESYMLAAVLTGLTVLGFQGLAEVACELESPFSSHSNELPLNCLLYTSPSPRDRTRSRMPSSA